ncbi:MAG: SusD/RagB family nutrient-binding outer membrane lipoprotein [Cyclobacteriaceae bacterium]|nr:SusD/RagB family nutrient-binding outer membrane lipoprotein [Cyclobacteriaceae bacterium]
MKKIFSYFMLPVLLIVASCDDFGDINVNPNASTTPLTSALLTNAQSTLGGSTTGGANFTAGLYAQYFSLTQYTEASLYATQNVDWGAEYAGSMYDLKNIININSDPATADVAALQGSNNNQIAIARILLAYRFSILTDRYGDIPYFEALQGNAQPTVDSQESIYTDLFKELKEAVAQFDNAGNVKGDIVYGGDNTKWKRFANSLRMILALRISEVNATLGKAQFLEALAADGGPFASNIDNATLVYPGGNFRNIWFGIGADQGVSDVIANAVNSTADPRRAAFGKPAGSALVGVPYGLKREDAIAWTAANPTWSLILNDGFRSEASTLFILTYADALLARAQAAYYGWTAENYVTLYNDALRASQQQWGVYDATTFASYIGGTAVALAGGGAAADDAKIATQRWLTFYPNGPQGWSEWRRTGFPVLTPTAEAINQSKQIPIRFPYPTVEYTFNGTKLQTAVTRMGGDLDGTHVWWDVD